jgi:transcriptional regulator with GAF, ATPase, and Fis domain
LHRRQQPQSRGAGRGGEFRADLFYRLDIVPLRLPPLRERAEDVPQLAAHFLRARGAARRFTPSALEALSRYSWPGNVRKVENLVERRCSSLRRPRGGRPPAASARKIVAALNLGQLPAAVHSSQWPPPERNSR